MLQTPVFLLLKSKKYAELIVFWSLSSMSVSCSPFSCSSCVRHSFVHPVNFPSSPDKHAQLTILETVPSREVNTLRTFSHSSIIPPSRHAAIAYLWIGLSWYLVKFENSDEPEAVLRSSNLFETYVTNLLIIEKTKFFHMYY